MHLHRDKQCRKQGNKAVISCDCVARESASFFSDKIRSGTRRTGIYASERMIERGRPAHLNRASRTIIIIKLTSTQPRNNAQTHLIAVMDHLAPVNAAVVAIRAATGPAIQACCQRMTTRLDRTTQPLCELSPNHRPKPTAPLQSTARLMSPPFASGTYCSLVMTGCQLWLRCSFPPPA